MWESKLKQAHDEALDVYCEWDAIACFFRFKDGYNKVSNGVLNQGNHCQSQDWRRRYIDYSRELRDDFEHTLQQLEAEVFKRLEERGLQGRKYDPAILRLKNELCDLLLTLEPLKTLSQDIERFFESTRAETFDFSASLPEFDNLLARMKDSLAEVKSAIRMMLCERKEEALISDKM